MPKGKFLINFSCIMKTGAPLAGALVLACIFSFLVSSSFCQAENAMVLPKGRWMTSLDFQIYPSWSKQYNDKGDEEDLDFDYNRELDNTVIPALGDFETAAGLPSGYASFGKSIVDFKKQVVITNVLLYYGVTDKLSVGLKIPYWDFTTKVKTDLDKSSATVARNPDATNNLGPILPTAELGNPATFNLSDAQIEALKLTKDDILDLLSDGVPDLGQPGYGYKRLETWKDGGLGDMDLALKYQYLQNDLWRLGLQGGIRFPTGQEDDPDNLVDYGFGTGNYALFLGFQNDYLGFKNLVLNASVRYTNQLPDKTTLRTPEDINQPLTDKTERVDRDQGDLLEAEFSVAYSFSSGFGLDAAYGTSFKAQDSVKGADGHIASLEDETDQVEHTFLVGASYNNISRFQQKKASVPFQVSLSYWNRFDGRNMNKACYYSVKGALFF